MNRKIRIAGLLIVIGAAIVFAAFAFFKPENQSLHTPSEVGAAPIPPTVEAAKLRSAQAKIISPSSASNAAKKPQPADISSIANNYEQLVEKADAGDPQAALDLHMGLYDCNWSTSAEGKAVLERDYSKIPITSSLQGPSKLRSRSDMQRDDLAVMEVMAKRTAACDKLPADLRSKAGEYLVRAADAGSVYAQRLYSTRGYPGDDATSQQMDEYNNRGFNYAERAAKTCDIDSISSLSEIYRLGGFGHDVDPVSALAYVLVLERLKGIGRDISTRLSAGLSPVEREKAALLASQFVATYCG